MKMAVLALLVPVLLVVSVSAQEKGEYKRWKLDIEYDTPDYVALEDGLGHVHLVWYMTYKVTNNTDMDVPLQIRIRGETDTKKHYRDSIAPLAQKVLEKETRKKFKNALDMRRGSLAAGKSLAAVAFFGDLDPNWDDFFVHIGGLVDPVDKVKGEMFFEKMILVLHWNRPGDEFSAQDDPITLKSDKFVREGERLLIPQKPID